KSASVKRIVASADAPAPTAIAAAIYAGPAFNSARNAGYSSGSTSTTRITCSPKTIVVADVLDDSGLRRIGSVPHNAAANATRSTPGTRIALSVAVMPLRNGAGRRSIPAGE